MTTAQQHHEQRRRGRDGAAVQRRPASLRSAQRAADTVAGVAGEVSARFPDAANSTKEAFQEANRMVQSGSDETLKVVGALSLGFAAGLLIGGANRLLVIAAASPGSIHRLCAARANERGHRQGLIVEVVQRG